MTPSILIQLVSEQTMQNLLPVLALAPSKLIHLVTAKTQERSDHIAEAVRQSGLRIDIEKICLSESPSIEESSRAVLRCINISKENRANSILNFTGGTKLMSIGAYLAAKEHKVSSVYVDTEHSMFVDGKTGQPIQKWFGNDLTFVPFARLLTVNAVAVANGRHRVTSGKNWEPYLKIAQHLFENPQEEEITWEAIHGQSGICRNGQEPRNPADWLALLEKPIRFPHMVASLASESGLLIQKGPATFLPDSSKGLLDHLASTDRPLAQDYFKAVRELQFSLAFLSGGWWEVIVAEAAQKSGRFRDLRCSINVGEPNGGFDPEEDLVGLDGVQIAYFSCKRGGKRARLIPLLDELDNRARAIGGKFTRRYLAVYLPVQGRLLSNFLNRARELNNIQLINGWDIKKETCFSCKTKG
ncbi:MAG: hypothetical protein ACO1QB_00220 [Verrucomicrobiales bacterium]